MVLHYWILVNMKYKKGHPQYNTGRTHFKKGQISPRKGIVLSDEIKEKISLSKRGQVSWNKGLKGYKSGKENCNWKGGITPINKLIRKTKEYKEWSISVYKRDRYICQDCGIKCQAKNIVAHHIKPFADYPESRFDIDNGVTLCRSCHFKLHYQLNKCVASLDFAVPA